MSNKVEYSRKYRLNNLEKTRKACRDWYERNPVAQREIHLKRRYGIDIEYYDLMSASQGGGCLICGALGEKLEVDHSHKTQEVRGLLCGNCNTGLGYFKDDTHSLNMAVAYLDKTGARPCTS